MPRIYESDTIAAISTPMGEGGIGMIRISGPEAVSIDKKIFHKKDGGEWVSHRLYYGHVVDPETGETVDEVMSVFMMAPKSYTREDVAEIHCHGGSLVTQRVLELVLREGARPAEAGEFTKRAFLNGRIDLTQAEAVIDLIRAKTPAGQDAASDQLAGRLFRRLSGVREELTRVLMHLEAYIDFPEEDIVLDAKERLIVSLNDAMEEVSSLILSYEEGRIYREGLTTVIAGRPNVGKSSLLNLLLKEKRAIVTAVPGTTRDVIEEYLNIKGVPLRLADTAGIRDTEDVVEIEGIRLAREALIRADIFLMVVDGSTPLTDDDLRIAEILMGKEGLLVVNKSDLPSAVTDQDARSLLPGTTAIRISASTGEGIDSLHEAIFRLAVHGKKEQSSGIVITRARHRDSLQKALEGIKRAVDAVEVGASPEFASLDLRAALDAISEIVGETTSDDILNRIFSEFCIGK